jgi:hypothetical protein
VVAALQAFVVSKGGKPQDDGPVLAAAQRVFVDLRPALENGD